MKKFISLVLVIVTSFSLFIVNGSAFGGYAHYTMGALIAAESDRSDKLKLAYASGCLLADIGRTTWDTKLRKWYKENDYPAEYYEKDNKKYYASDEYLFTEAMYDVSKKVDGFSASSKVMAYGWRDHYIQDRYGEISKITSRPWKKYSLDCGWIDEYLRDESVFSDYPIQDNALDEIYISYALIRKTYEAITNGEISPSNDEIKEEIKDMFAAYDALIFANTSGWSETQISEINNELLRTMELCPGPYASHPSNYEKDKELEIKTSIYLSAATNTSTNKLITKTTETDNTIVYDDLSNSDLKKLTQYMKIEEKTISDDEAYISISITNENAYNQNLNRICTEKLSVVSK